VAAAAGRGATAGDEARAARVWRDDLAQRLRLHCMREGCEPQVLDAEGLCHRPWHWTHVYGTHRARACRATLPLAAVSSTLVQTGPLHAGHARCRALGRARSCLRELGCHPATKEAKRHLSSSYWSGFFGVTLLAVAINTACLAHGLCRGGACAAHTVHAAARPCMRVCMHGPTRGQLASNLHMRLLACIDDVHDVLQRLEPCAVMRGL
jgi:hypothetical protein